MKRVSRQTFWLVFMFGIGCVSCFAYLHAQEATETRQDRTRARPATRSDATRREDRTAPSVAAPAQRVQFQRATDGGAAVRQSHSATPLSDTAKPTLVLTMWVVTLAESAGHADDEKAKLKERLNTLPPEFQSLNEVRDFIKSLKAANRVRSWRELRMITLDGQPAQLQVGSELPQIVGTSMSNRGRQNSLQYRSVGTMVEARPHIDSEKHIQVQLDYNMSDTAKSNDVALSEDNDGKSQFADVMIKRQFKTTVRLSNGSAVIAHCDASTGSADKSGDGLTELIIVGGTIAGASN
jgi:Flp pilus assembly secretin CpaC